MSAKFMTELIPGRTVLNGRPLGPSDSAAELFGNGRDTALPTSIRAGVGGLSSPSRKGDRWFLSSRYWGTEVVDLDG